jgi:hypothetical protein
MLSMVPLAWRWGALLALALALFGSGYARGLAHEQAAHAVEDARRAQAEEKAILARVQENTAQAVQQLETNRAITKVHDEELAPVVARIAAERVRVGPRLCAGQPATAADPARPGGGDAADSAGRLVLPDLEERIKELEQRVETALAAGRACQAFVRGNGMAD